MFTTDVQVDVCIYYKPTYKPPKLLYCYKVLIVNYVFNIGIKHDFPFINMHKVPREALKTEGKALCLMIFDDN